MWPAGNWSRKVREISENSFEITHRAADSVVLECTVMDLHIGTTFGINSAPLKVACGPPPGIGAKI
jgi:hypothetical protein